MSEQKRQMLYNKYRPKVFDDVLGQEHINDVLKGLIKTGNFKLLNSLIFVGSAGGGKTTSARIFAKAVNCVEPVEGNPCGQCKNCKDFDRNGYNDYIEVDGASYNKVEDAKQLVQIANQYPINPNGYRCIMIDEAHRLSNSAWDIFLKLLEEGENRTIFLFATTEPDKIRPAIKSRSLLFGIKPLTAKQILKLLTKVCKAEGISYDKESLKKIAHYNKGKTRDSLKTLDTYYLSHGEVVDITIEVPETLVLDAMVLSAQGEIDKAYSKLDLLLGQEFDVRQSVSKIMIDIWRFPDSAESGVSEDLLERANILFQPIIKGMVQDFMSYPFNDLESFKMFLLLVSDKSLTKGKTVSGAEVSNRRFRDNVKGVKTETKGSGKPEETNEVSKLEGLLKKAGFDVVD
jgi:DNA polymerase III subunit gamma/tau